MVKRAPSLFNFVLQQYGKTSCTFLSPGLSKLKFSLLLYKYKLLLFLLFSIRPSQYDTGRSAVIRNPMIKTEQNNTGENRRGGSALSSETFQKDQNQPIKVIHKFIYYYPCKE